MLQRSLAFVSSILLTVSVLGCSGGSFSFAYYDDAPVRTVRVHTEHVCTHDCHHFYNGTRLVVIDGHRHGHGCGHHWDGGHWIVSLALGGHGPSAHICSRSCHHHYHDGTRLVVLSGHRHGHGCGHRWSGKLWVSVKLGHGTVKNAHARPTHKKAKARVGHGHAKTKKATTKAVHPRKAKSKTLKKTTKSKSSKSRKTKSKKSKSKHSKHHP